MSNTSILPANELTPINSIAQTYSLNSNVNFYALANPTYFQFFNKTVKHWGHWYDGWVPNFHNYETGTFSTRFTTSFVDNTMDLISGQKIILEKVGEHEDDDVLRFASKWIEESGLQKQYRLANRYAGALGTSLLKLNKTGSKLWVDCLRFDYFYFSVDARGELDNVTMLCKAYETSNGSDEKHRDNYYLVEKRYFDYRSVKKVVNGEVRTIIERVPMVIYQVMVYYGQSTNKTYSFSSNHALNPKNIPYAIECAIKRDYPAISLSKPIQLGFRDIGCYLMKYEEDGSNPLSPFGRSIVDKIMSYAMVYDKAWSWLYRDMYLGKGVVLVPSPMQLDSGQKTFSTDMYTLIPSLNPDEQKPINVQFEIRETQFKDIMNDAITNSCSAIGIDSKTFSPSLSGQGVKTATEIDAENDLTLSFIENHRMMIAPVLNQLIETVLTYYQKVGNVRVRFSTPSLVNKDKILDRVMLKLDKGLIDRKTAMRELYPDMDDRQLEEMLSKIKEEEKEKADKEAVMWENNQYGI